MSERTRPAISVDIEDQRLPDPPLTGGGFGFPGPAGFPWVDTVATTQITTNATSHTVGLPPTIPVGALLLMILACDGSPTTCTATGWTSVTAGGSSANCSVTILYRIADGTEGATVTVTTSASEQLTAWVGILKDHHASAAPEGTSGGVGTAETQLTFPAALTPSWGADDTLWFAIVVGDGSATAGITHLAQPLQYVYVYSLPNANTTTVSLAIAYRWLNAASTTPTRFVQSTAEQYAHAIVAIRPA